MKWVERRTLYNLPGQTLQEKTERAETTNPASFLLEGTNWRLQWSGSKWATEAKRLIECDEFYLGNSTQYVHFLGYDENIDVFHPTAYVRNISKVSEVGALLWPVMTWARPFDEKIGYFRKEEWYIASDNAEWNRRPCWLLATDRSPSVPEQIWVDKEMQVIVHRVVQVRDIIFERLDPSTDKWVPILPGAADEGNTSETRRCQGDWTPAMELSIEYEPVQEIVGYAVSGWTAKSYNQGVADRRNHEQTAAVQVRLLDRDIDDIHFEAAFPVGTEVYDSSGSTKRRYIVRPNGAQREITEAELARGAKWNELLDTDSGTAKPLPPKSNAFLIIMSNVGLAALALLIWRLAVRRRGEAS